MDIIEFAQKAWYMEWGLINRPLPEITRLYKENLRNQKKFFWIKNKKSKWIMTTQQEEIFFGLTSKNIIW